MFKNDRMMLILTGLVLAIFAGSMVQYSDKILALMAGEDVVATQDDSYSVRAGASQILDVLSNDNVKGPIVVLTRPSCGAVEMSSNNRLSFSSSAECTGEVEFAYCVDAEGECEPNAVKINVISVSFAQAETTNTNDVEQTQAAQLEPAAPPAPATEAPEIESFSVEMAPPALAAPSVSEIVSPGVAVASIRRASNGLNSASITDQNIATQNSASINQAPLTGPTAFAAPEIGESSNISLGGSQRVVVSTDISPSNLQAASNGDSNLAPLERGPEALDSLLVAQVAPAAPDLSPLPANPERNVDAPVFVASAQADGPTPDTQFNAEPTNGGPIALIALNPTVTRGNAAGESLNIILTEPGVQSFTAPASNPAALAPASAQPTAVSVLERAPNVAELVSGPAALALPSDPRIGYSNMSDHSVMRNHINMPQPALALLSNTTRDVQVVASQPNQIAVPSRIMRHDTVSRFISVSRNTGLQNRTASFAALTAPESLVFTLPTLDLRAAQAPQIIEASLPATPQTPVITAPAQNSSCEIGLSAVARSGANIALDITAACKPNQMVTIEHSGLSFSMLTDAQGAAFVLVPAMEADAKISVRFEDQSSQSTQISLSDMNSVVRTGVSWQADMNLDLSAIEFGAAIGSEGHITPETPRDYRASRLGGGGYLLQLGDPSLARGALAEVYTLSTTSNQQRGTIALSIVIKDVAPVCGQTILAKTVRSRDDRSASIRNVRFTVPSCNTVVSGPIALPGAVDDIRIAGR
ncbi:MAG: hypothetical protein GQ535_05685 [Rhodobacteraceae bacterium]|nr:hypothetical protein [Paracoccaceae bacterium]